MKMNNRNDTRNKQTKTTTSGMKEEKREKKSRFVEREEILDTQADYVLSQIAREKCDHETKMRMMRVVATAYGLDKKHINYVLRGNVEHTGGFSPPDNVNSIDIDDGLMHLQKMFMEFTKLNIDSCLLRKIERVVSCCLLIFLNRENPKAMKSLALNYVIDQVHSYNKSLIELVSDLVKIAVYGINTLVDDDNISTVCEQNGIHFSKDIITAKKITALMRRPFMTHAKLLCSLFCTLGYLDEIEWSIAGFEIFTAKAFTGEHTTFADLMDMCLEATLYFINTGYACFSTLSLRPLFITSSLMYELELAVDKLEIDTVNYKVGCGSVESNSSELLARTYRLISDVQSNFHNIKPIEKPVAIKLSKKLQHIESDILTTIRGQCVRTAPYCVKTYGRSGVGKTSFNNIIMYEVLRMNGFPYDKQNIAKIEPTDKFWSNVTNTTMGITIDDMANTVANKAKEDPVQLLIMLCNNQPQMVPRAEVDEKGTVYVQAKYVGVTTNYRTLAAEHWSVEPMSALRRCHLHIDLTVKAEYATIDKRLDPNLAINAPKNGYIQDLWDIDVCEVGLAKKKPNTTQCEQYEFRPVKFRGKPLKKVNIFTLLEFIREHSHMYFLNQSLMLKSQDMVSNMPVVCNECNAITEICKCMKPVPKTVSTEQAGILMTGLSLFTFITTMSGVFGTLGTLFYKLLLPNVIDDATIKFFSICRILFQPNYFERVVINQFLQGTRSHCTAAAIDLFHRYIDFNMSVLPTWLTHSSWATGLYFYIHRDNVTRSWYDHHAILTIIMCLILAIYLYFIELEKGMIILPTGYMRTGDTMEHAFLIYIGYYAFSLVCFLIANVDKIAQHYVLRAMCSMTQKYLHWLHYYDTGVLLWLLYLLYHEVTIVKFMTIICVLVAFYLVLVISVVYDRITILYTKLQKARCNETCGTIFRKWEFPTYGQYQLNKDTPVGRILNTTNVITLVAFLGVMRLALRTYRLLVETRDQGGALSCDSVAQAEERETKTNVWDNIKTYVSLPGTYGVDGALSKIKKNLVFVTITRAVTPVGVVYPNTYCAAIMVKGKIMLLPYHMLYERRNGEWLHRYLTFDMSIVRSSSNNGWKENVTVDKAHRFGYTDIVAIPTYGGGSFKDITQLFPDECGYAGTTTTITRTRDGNIVTHNSVISQLTAIVHKRYDRNSVVMDWEGTYVKRGVPWENGDCMSVTVSRTSQPHIVGLHLLGRVVMDDHNIGCSITLTREQITTYLAELPDNFIKYTPAEMRSQVHGIDVGFKTTIDHRSPVNFVEQSNYTVLGSIGVSATYKSKVRPSKAAAYFVDAGLGPQKWGPPKFQGVTGYEHWAPWYAHLSTVGQVATCVPDDVLEVAITNYKQPLILLMKLHHAKVRVLTEIETVNGFEASRFLTGLNKKTSMGYPFGGVKDRMLEPCGVSHTGKPLFNFPSHIWEKWYDMETDILNNIVPITIFKATLKDEPTKMDKDKVRVFQAADIVFQLGIRKYFLPIIRVLCLHPLVSECAVGINPFSLEWQAVHDHVVFHGKDNIVAGDYKSWDMLLPSKLVSSCMNLLVDLVDTPKLYTQRDIKIMRGICAILADPVIHLNGTLIRYHGSVPSGHNLTSILNSVCNSILLRCCFYRLNSVALDFRKHCTPITYGDDFMLGVNREVVFGLDKYARFLDTEVGIKVTMPDKSSLIVPYMSINDVDFLKRKSVYIPELETHIGVLDLNSIHKSLYTTMCNTFDEDNILCAVLESAMHELFYHGRQVYEKYIAIFGRMLKDLDIFTNIVFKSYDQRVCEWHVKYGKTDPNIITLDDGRAAVTLVDDENIGGPEDADNRDEGCMEIKPFSNTLKQRLTDIININNSDDNTVKRGRQLPNTTVEQAGVNTEPENISNTLLQFDTHDSPAHIVRSLRDDTFDVIHNHEHALQDALKRPVPIYNTTWPVNGEIPYTNINLVGAWISNSRFVREKVSNYRYLRGTFCVKVTVNGSPFMYGKSILSSQYWPDMAGISELTLTQATSLPYISIMPCNGVAGCMSIPILHPHGHLALTTLTTPIRLVLQTMNPLRTVQDALDPVHVTVWAWMSDYVLSVPTSLPVNPGWEQGGDEYKQPIASTTATALSALAGIARNVPYIGPYARASEIACSAVGNIAQIFGFSKPASIIETRVAKIKPISDLANTNGGDCSTKLSLDIKQEVTVDSSVTGFDGNDDMLIHNIAKREAYLTSFSFSTSNGVNTMIWKGVVSPCIMRMFAGAFVRDQSVRLYSVTPLAHVSLPFQYWRGTLKYRFEIIASPFHKGKIRFLHEPSVQADDSTASWTDDTTLAPSYVVDLALQREFIMELKWCHHSNYLRTTIVKDFIETNNERMFETDPTLILDQTVDAFNGFVGVVVQEPLTCATNDNVFINVYVSATDDFELQTLSDAHLQNMHTFNMNTVTLEPGGLEQSGVDGIPESPDNDLPTTLDILPTTNKISLTDHLAQIHFGERILSLRQLIKRYMSTHSLYATQSLIVQNGTTLYFWRLNDFPPYAGADLNGMEVDVSGAKWNFASPCNLLTYFAPCFLMRRGSLRNKYLLMRNEPAFNTREWYNIVVARSTAEGYEKLEIPIQRTSINDYDAKLNYNGLTHSQLMMGAELSVPASKLSVEVELPYYNNKRWVFAQDRDINVAHNPSSGATPALRQQTFHTVTAEMNALSGATSRIAQIRRYVAAGDDFSFTCYMFPPTLIQLSVFDYKPET
jgi:hypothetical protein